MKTKLFCYACTLMIICLLCSFSAGNASSTPELVPTPALWQYDSYDDPSVFDADWMNPDYSTAIVGTFIRKQLDKRYSSVGAGLLFNCGTPWIDFTYYLSSFSGTAYIWKSDADTNHLAVAGYKYTYNAKSKEWTSERSNSDMEDELKSAGIPYLTVDTEQLTETLQDCYPLPTAVPSPIPSPAQPSTLAPFGFDLPADTLARMGDEMYRDALTWGVGTTLVNYNDFPIVPSNLDSIHNSIVEMATSLQISGTKAIWKSGFEDLCSGEHGTIISDNCYGWNESGEDILFLKANDNTYESTILQDASDADYVRQERAWENGDYQYAFMVDFFEAKKEYGERITSIIMRNNDTDFELGWQINSQCPERIMIDVTLFSVGKRYSFEYNSDSQKLSYFSYSEY